jgi:hypothetical protein
MKTKVTFKLSAEIVGDAKGVVLVGEFNDWNIAQGIALKQKKDGSWSVKIELKVGNTYQYRYCLSDGRWVSDDKVDSAIHPENCIVTVTVPESKDDLTKIDGIGKKIAELLVEANITTFKDLANAPLNTLQVILKLAGSRYKSYDPSLWSEQAKTLADKTKAKKQLSIDESLAS